MPRCPPLQRERCRHRHRTMSPGESDSVSRQASGPRRPNGGGQFPIGMRVRRNRLACIERQLDGFWLPVDSLVRPSESPSSVARSVSAAVDSLIALGGRRYTSVGRPARTGSSPRRTTRLRLAIRRTVVWIVVVHEFERLAGRQRLERVVNLGMSFRRRRFFDNPCQDSHTCHSVGKDADDCPEHVRQFAFAHSNQNFHYEPSLRPPWRLRCRVRCYGTFVPERNPDPGPSCLSPQY